MRKPLRTVIVESKPTNEKSSEPLSLSKISVGETVFILGLQLEGKLRDYVMRFGFVPGATVSVLRKVPLSGIRVYRVGQSQIALRPETADAIIVTGNGA